MELSKALAGSAKGKQQQSGQNEQEVPEYDFLVLF